MKRRDFLKISSVFTGGFLFSSCAHLGRPSISSNPVIIASKYGKGRVVYIGASLEERYATHGVNTIRKLMDNAIVWVSQSEPMVEISGPTSIVSNLTEKGNTRALHLLNHCGSITENAVRMIDDIVPLYNTEIELKNPEGKTPVSVKSNETGNGIEFTKTKDGISFVLPKLDIYECLLIEYK